MQAAAPRHGRHDSASGPISLEVGRALSASSRRVAGPGVGMAEAEQKIDIGGPGADAMNHGQRGVGLVRRLLDQGGKIELAAIDGFCNGLERANFRRGKAGAGESLRTRA